MIFVRVGVAQTIRAENEIKMKRQSNKYKQALNSVLNISKNKTTLLSALRQEITCENLDKIIQNFENTDKSCQTILEHCSHASVEAVTKLNRSLEGIVKNIPTESSSSSSINHSPTIHIAN